MSCLKPSMCCANATNWVPWMKGRDDDARHAFEPLARTETKVIQMSHFLSSVLVFAAVAVAAVRYAGAAYLFYLDARRSRAGPSPARRVLRVLLLRVALRAVQVAARLDRIDVPVPHQAAPLAIRPYAPGGARGVRFVQAAVVLAVVAYFVAGLLAVFFA